jgi:hypothetical protein
MMIDMLSVGIVSAATAIGYVAGSRRRRTGGNDNAKPICLCGEQYGAHDPETGACQGGEYVSINQGNGRYKDVWVRCPCVRYTGPQPLETYWVSPIADANIVVAPRPQVTPPDQLGREATDGR